MLRKSRIAALILLSSCVAQAWSSGFYVGAGAGPEAQDYKVSTTLFQDPDVNFTNIIHLSGIGVFGSVYGGYAWTCNPFYLAGEANYNRSSASLNERSIDSILGDSIKTTYKMPYNYGISILPGYMFDACNVIYARLGYAWSNYNISTQDTFFQM